MKAASFGPSEKSDRWARKSELIGLSLRPRYSQTMLRSPT